MKGYQFDPDLDPEIADDLIDAAEEVGLESDRVELLGQAPGLARQFVTAVAKGYHDEFLGVVDWKALAGKRRRRRESARWAVEMALGSRPPGST